MKMGIRDEFDGFRSRLGAGIDFALETEVAEVLKQKVRESVYANVYAAYSPKMYLRRQDDGGLSDTENYLVSLSGEHTLELLNISSDDGNGRHITDVVESGVGYDFWDGAFARPFMEEALQAGLADGSLEGALMRGLRAQGF
ncbi:MAG: hypothetical protein RR394_05395 [Oscillospiraceae bacterium]